MGTLNESIVLLNLIEHLRGNVQEASLTGLMAYPDDTHLLSLLFECVVESIESGFQLLGQRFSSLLLLVPTRVVMDHLLLNRLLLSLYLFQKDGDFFFFLGKALFHLIDFIHQAEDLLFFAAIRILDHLDLVQEGLVFFVGLDLQHPPFAPLDLLLFCAEKSLLLPSLFLQEIDLFSLLLHPVLLYLVLLIQALQLLRIAISSILNGLQGQINLLKLPE